MDSGILQFRILYILPVQFLTHAFTECEPAVCLLAVFLQIMVTSYVSIHRLSLFKRGGRAALKEHLRPMKAQLTGPYFVQQGTYELEIAAAPRIATDVVATMSCDHRVTEAICWSNRSRMQRLSPLGAEGARLEGCIARSRLCKRFWPLDWCQPPQNYGPTPRACRAPGA